MESAYYNLYSSKHGLTEVLELLKRTPLEEKRIIDAKIVNEILNEKDNVEPFEINVWKL